MTEGVPMSRRAAVVGVGMIAFTTPRNTAPYDVMAEAAARKALTDAGIDYALVQQGYVGYVYGDSTSGQAALYGLGQTGIPIVNVNNNCSTGSSALFLARQAIENGACRLRDRARVRADDARCTRFDVERPAEPVHPFR